MVGPGWPVGHGISCNVLDLVRMPHFEVIGLSLSVAGRELARNINLQLDAGEALGIAGPSGCGKTTLLRCLAGLIDPDAGTLRLKGQAPEGLGWPVWRRQVCYVAQKPSMFSGSVMDNLLRPHAYRHNRHCESRRLLGWLEELGLASADERDAGSLSVGEQQRVALVRAWGLQPEVLLLDEPTSALDQGAVNRVEGILAKLRGEGMAQILVTHDEAQRERWCTNICRMTPIEEEAR